MPADFARLSRLLSLSAESRPITNIGAAGTDFSATGGLTLADALRGPDGAAATPGIRFASEATGLYLNAAGQLGVALAGVAKLLYSAGAWQWQENVILSSTGTLTVRLSDGAVGTPVLSFANDPDTGIFRQAADDMGFTVGGSQRVRFTTTVMYTWISPEWQVDGAYFAAGSVDNYYLGLRARDNGVGLVEVARLQGAADPYFQATLFMVLAPVSQPVTPVEGHFGYNSATNKLNFYNGVAWEVITSAGFGWQSFEQPTLYRNIYNPENLNGRNTAEMVGLINDGLADVETLGWPLLDYKWHKSDFAVMRVDHIEKTGYTHALPYPLEAALKETVWAATVEYRIQELEKELTVLKASAGRS